MKNEALKILIQKYPDYIQPYGEDLIEKLRNFYSYGIPLSIVLISNPMCVGYSFTGSILFSQVMKKFKIVRGNINSLPRYKKTNHCWIEIDDYVYDTVDNCRWNKDLYYRMYEPEIIEVVTDQDYMKDNDYVFALNRCKEVINDSEGIQIILGALELIEEERPTINHDLLLREIELFRNKMNLSPMPSYYKSYVKSMSKKLFPDYYNLINQAN